MCACFLFIFYASDFIYSCLPPSLVPFPPLLSSLSPLSPFLPYPLFPLHPPSLTPSLLLSLPHTFPPSSRPYHHTGRSSYLSRPTKVETADLLLLEYSFVTNQQEMIMFRRKTLKKGKLYSIMHCSDFLWIRLGMIYVLITFTFIFLLHVTSLSVSS